ncbi:MAG: proton-conducting membrane transporter [Clostridia bacterium]|nr:proton-conducting membrane transporter [Clostridia bacterium]
MNTATNSNDLLLLLPLLLPALGGLAVAFLPFLNGKGARRAAVAVTLLLTAAAAFFVLLRPDASLTLFTLAPDVAALLKTDKPGRLFMGLIGLIFLPLGAYSFSSMRPEQNEKRFFAFFLFTLAALMGLSLCGNLATLLLFFVILAALSFPLALAGTKEAASAAIKYLIYAVIGAALALGGMIMLNRFIPGLAFVPGGALGKAAGKESGALAAIFLVGLGFSALAGLFPLHGWLPAAHAASPAGAALSGVVTKAGALGVIRVIYSLVGADFLRGTWVQTAWIALALVTVFMGSVLAFKEGLFQKRLGYSAVSQGSCILFGLFTLTRSGVMGALLLAVFHSILQIALSMAAGAVIDKTGKAKVSELTGIGKQMPVTMGCFALASLGLVGIPPACGFVSMWYLAQGGLETAYTWNWVGPAVLLASAVLAAGYLFSIVIRGFFPGKGVPREALPKAEPSAAALLPLAILAALCLALGMFPGLLTDFVGGVAAALV